MSDKEKFCDEFLQGQRDCRDGVPHEAGKGESYDRGYSAQYQHEQNMSAISEARSTKYAGEVRK